MSDPPTSAGGDRALRVIAVVIAGLLIAGGAGAIGIHPAADRGPARAAAPRAPTPSPVSTAVTAPAAGTAPRSTAAPVTVPVTGPEAPVSSTLQGALLVPIDQGGFYTVDPALGSADLAGSSCLATLAHQPGQTGTALTYLEGPNRDGLPGITELLTSYPASGAPAAFRAAESDLARCRDLSTVLAGGGRIRVQLAAFPLTPLGEADIALQGRFSLDGVTQTMTIAVVERDPVVLTMIYLDSVPPASALYDDFASTLTTAFGKLA